MSIERLSTNLPSGFNKDSVVQEKSVDVITKKDSVQESGIRKTIGKETELSKEDLEKLVKGMNDSLKPLNTSLKFEMHEELNEYYVKIVDNLTQEVVKEIPSKKVLDMYAAMTKFMGLLVDKKI
jgi:flagellar protein FlaG